MATTRMSMPHSPDAVFAVLADGQRYAEWVVGAKRIRGVDEGWPALGKRIHHTVGIGPLTIDDTTACLEVDPPVRIVLEARAWPAGKARVTMTITPEPGGSEVVMDEVPTGGPAKTLFNPVLDGLTHLRNLESLRRLKAAAGRQPAATS